MLKSRIGITKMAPNGKTIVLILYGLINLWSLSEGRVENDLVELINNKDNCSSGHSLDRHMPYWHGCGQFSTTRRQSDRLSGGIETDPGRVPFHLNIVSVVEMWNSTTNKYYEIYYNCGGVLIGNQHILTAAHCFHDLSIKKVLAKWHHAGIVIDASKRCAAQMYEDHTGATWNDVAIVKLERPIQLGNTIQPACLPQFPLDKDVQLFALGKSVTGSIVKPGVLFVKEVPCRRKDARKTVLCVQANVDEYPGESCNGDSGSAVIAMVQGRWTVFGLLSYGRGGNCKKRSKINMYADVYQLGPEVTKLLRECL